MNTSGQRTINFWLCQAVIGALLLAMPLAAANGQAVADKPAASALAADAAKSSASDTSTASDAKSTSDADKGPAEKADTATTSETKAGDAKGVADAATADVKAAEAKGDGAAAAAANPPAAGGVSPWMMGVLIVALFVIPILLGNYIARSVRMPDYGWKIGLVLFTILAGAVIVAIGEFKFGPDLAGGITLIYEIEDTSVGAVPEPGADAGKGAADDQKGAVNAAPAPAKKVPMAELISALKQRIDPTGTQEISIRAQGPTAVEIIIPKTGQDALEYVKRRITDLGQLEFRITADPRWPRDRPKIEQAKLAPPNQKDVFLGGQKVAEWVAYDTKEFRKDDDRLVRRMAGDTPEALVLMDPWNVTGDYLSNAAKGADERGGPAVHFSFNSQGAQRFRQLTGQNLRDPATGLYRNLGILLDKRLISAPNIQSTISDQGQISGGAMTEKEVDFVVSILNAGSLPATLNKTPISQVVISPTLGAVTIKKGEQAIVVSFISIVVFMLLYYRLSGVIAVAALFINLLLVLAAMVLIRAAFTLPGLAGLVLTIGIAVDANVLIFERMREELRHGAALRMAIRNGFGRATRTIIDANMTTIIAAVVMYTTGSGPLRGFAVTLILGVLVSMYTAIFCSRIVFDILERRGWITTLKMNSIIGETNVDFMGWQCWAIGTSWVLILIGMVGCYFRGSSLLNIDFTGGSTVTFVLDEAHPKPINEVQAALDKTDLFGKNLLVVRNGEKDTRYTVNTSEQAVDKVKQTIIDTFGNELLNYSVEFSNLKPFTDGALSGTEADLVVNSGSQFDLEDGVSHDALLDWIKSALSDEQRSSVVVSATNPNYHSGSSVRFKQWSVRLMGLQPDGARAVLEKMKTTMNATPMFPLANQIGGRVSTNLQINALRAIALSCIGIIVYLWLRFQQVTFGLAAVIALLHDVFITTGMVALSAFFVSLAPGLAKALQIDGFQISLEIVAALLTIIGYSVNDTIIVFDRLREVRGKSPDLTKDMINACVNQTLSRTLLTAFTVFLVVVILYWFGGEGVHGFAFCMVIGVFVGCYSSIYIAAPILYWLIGTHTPPASASSKAA
jgi:SecD/SecF fusion protein